MQIVDIAVSVLIATALGYLHSRLPLIYNTLANTVFNCCAALYPRHVIVGTETRALISDSEKLRIPLFLRLASKIFPVYHYKESYYHKKAYHFRGVYLWVDTPPSAEFVEKNASPPGILLVDSDIRKPLSKKIAEDSLSFQEHMQIISAQETRTWMDGSVKISLDTKRALSPEYVDHVIAVMFNLNERRKRREKLKPPPKVVSGDSVDDDLPNYDRETLKYIGLRPPHPPTNCRDEYKNLNEFQVPEDYAKEYMIGELKNIRDDDDGMVHTTII